MRFQWLVVGGCPRSGTTAFLDCINYHNNIGLIPEYNFFNLLEKFEPIFYKEAHSRKKSWIGNINANQRGENARVLLKDFIPTIPQISRDLKPTVKGLFSGVFPDKDLIVLGEKLPLYYKNPYRENLEKHFYPVKYIHLIRNPLYVVNSFMHRKKLTQEGKDLWKYNDLDTAMSMVQESFMFAKKNSKDKETFLILKYEDFFNKPEQTYQTVFDYLEVPYQEIPKFSGDKYGPLNSLTQKDIVRINKVFPSIMHWDNLPVEEIV